MYNITYHFSFKLKIVSWIWSKNIFLFWPKWYENCFCQCDFLKHIVWTWLGQHSISKVIYINKCTPGPGETLKSKWTHMEEECLRHKSGFLEKGFLQTFTRFVGAMDIPWTPWNVIQYVITIQIARKIQTGFFFYFGTSKQPQTTLCYEYNDFLLLRLRLIQTSNRGHANLSCNGLWWYFLSRGKRLNAPMTARYKRYEFHCRHISPSWVSYWAAIVAML